MMEACMAEKQVYSDYSLTSPGGAKLSWNWSGNNQVVPPNKILDITALTLSYFPQGSGTVGRAGVNGRDANDSPVWRLQVLFVEKDKTLHLPFPLALRLEAGGYVELGFTTDKDILFISANGRLLDV
jgi:hypothetical protein